MTVRSIEPFAVTDLSTSARIRWAALKLFGERGYDHTTIRQIADAAEVSPGLVIHHFQAKAKLREACDAWVLEWVGSEQGSTVTAGGMPPTTQWLSDHPELAVLLDYLGASLRSGGPTADRLFDQLVAVTIQTLEAGITVGAINPIDDVPGTAAVMVGYSCGAILLTRQIGRHLGGASLNDSPAIERYYAIGMRLFSKPVFTESMWAHDASLADNSSDSKD